MTFRIQSLVYRADDILVRRRRVRDMLQFLCKRASGDRHAVAMQQAGVEQDLQHLRDPARLVQIDGHIFARRLEVANDRNLAPHALEIVESPFHFGGMADR